MIAGTANDNTGSGFGVGFSFDPNVNLAIGQQFFVNTLVLVDSVTVYLNDDDPSNGADPFTLYITNAIGSSATAANVLRTLNGSFPLTPGDGSHGGVTFSGLNLLLPANMMDGYFLVVSSAGGPMTGWGTGGTLLSSMLGGIGSSFVGIQVGGAVADYHDLDPNNPNQSVTNFRVDGMAVPEPSSVAFLLAGAGALFMARQRRKKVA